MFKSKNKTIDNINLDKGFIDRVEDAVKGYYFAYSQGDKLICGKEERQLRRMGKKDGKMGHPSVDSDGKLMSPNIEKEHEALKEKCNEIWALLQLQDERNFSKMKDLFGKTKRMEQELTKANAELAEKLSQIPDLSLRKNGDENLNDAQVVMRRRREYEAEIKPYKDRVQSIRSEMMGSVMEAEKTLTEITERQNYTRLRCQKLFDHTRQRIDIYYRAALIKHPQRQNMPLSVKVDLIHEAEATFLSQHHDYVKQAEEHILYLKHTYDLVPGEEIAEEDKKGGETQTGGRFVPADIHQTRTLAKKGVIA